MSATPPELLARHFGAKPAEAVEVFEPDYNVAPSKLIWIVATEGGERRLLRARWGLLPPWAKDPSLGQRMINARAETIHEKPAFRQAFRRRRCIIPADGFYEWADREGGGRKQPWYIHDAGGAPLALAGLWEVWRARTGGGEGRAHGADADGVEGLRSCSIVTRPADGPVARVHDRMPLLLDEATWDRWLDASLEDPDEVRPLLAPDRSTPLELRPVSTAVNSPRSSGARLIEPLDGEAAAQ